MIPIRSVEAVLELREIIKTELNIDDLMVVITNVDIRLKKRRHKNTLVRIKVKANGAILTVSVANKVSGRIDAGYYVDKITICDIHTRNMSKLAPLLNAIKVGYTSIYSQ